MTRLLLGPEKVPQEEALQILLKSRKFRREFKRTEGEVARQWWNSLSPEERSAIFEENEKAQMAYEEELSKSDPGKATDS